MSRNNLAEKLDMIGSMFEIDGMTELLAKFDKEMGNVKFSAVVFQIASLLIQKNQKAADRIIGMNLGLDEKGVAALDDARYADALKTAIITDVMGFFASSPPTDGEK